MKFHNKLLRGIKWLILGYTSNIVNSIE